MTHNFAAYSHSSVYCNNENLSIFHTVTHRSLEEIHNFSDPYISNTYIIRDFLRLLSDLSGSISNRLHVVYIQYY